MSNLQHMIYSKNSKTCKKTLHQNNKTQSTTTKKSQTPKTANPMSNKTPDILAYIFIPESNCMQ